MVPNLPNPLDSLRKGLRRGTGLVTQAAGDIRSMADELHEARGLPQTIVLGEDIDTMQQKASGIEAGCIPCAIGHFSTATGLLNEGVRFARKDGMDSVEVIDRVGQSIDELNAMERDDLRPEKIVLLSETEQTLANDALNMSRQLRHRLENLTTVEELVQAAADTQTFRRQIGQAWYYFRRSQMSDEQKESLQEKAQAQMRELEGGENEDV